MELQPVAEASLSCCEHQQQGQGHLVFLVRRAEANSFVLGRWYDEGGGLDMTETTRDVTETRVDQTRNYDISTSILCGFHAHNTIPSRVE